MEAIATTRKIGGSLVVTIPKTLVEAKKLGENQLIKITVSKVKRSGFGMFKGIGLFTKADKFKGQLE